eukprot:GEMP01034097.1.p2 GENE.GEMP01034097.1~~GEMP01034097.1.p2  ORF type:complete len:102 (+),score=22.29 GEMP01034097.1:148-453(+)
MGVGGAEDANFGICVDGTECIDLECTLWHPEGRDMDDRRRLRRADMRNDMAEFAADVERIVLQQTWFPDYRNCACCHGYVYNCTNVVCVNNGECRHEAKAE